LIIWGSRGKVLSLLNLGKEKCECCNNECDFILVIAFRYGHIFWIPLFITTRKYYKICSKCEKEYALENAEVDKLIKSPIPWIYKFGWSIPVGLLGLWLFSVLLLNI